MSAMVITARTKLDDDEEHIQRPDMAPLSAAELFLKAAVTLKQQVVEATWMVEDRRRCNDPTAYSGLLGTALLCLRAYEATRSPDELLLCAEIVDTCIAAARSCRRHVTFLTGRAGVYATAAVVANYRADRQLRDLYLDLFLEVARDPALPIGPDEGGFGMSYELLYGRAGFLYATLFINHHLGPNTIPHELLAPIVNAVLAGGRAGAADHPECPLMYRLHGTRYWGAAHGLAGILQVLLHFPLFGDDLNDVCRTLKYMVRNRFMHSGNYPCSESNRHDSLVQWSDGAGGIGITLSKAAEVFQDKDFRDAAVDSGEVVWNRGLTNRKFGLADGIAGNAYALLSLYRLTGEDIYLERAEAFAGFLYDNARKLVAAHGNEGAYSLFQGLAGLSCLWFDLVSPRNGRFPGYEI